MATPTHAVAMKPISARTGAMLVLLASAAEAYLIKGKFPEYMPHERISRVIIYLFLPNFWLFMLYRWYIFPWAFSPYRHLPKPKDTWWIWGNASCEVSKPPGQEMLGWINNIPNDGLLSFRHFGEHRLIATSPAALKSVLSDHVYDWQKPHRVIEFLARILGLGLILAEGDVHKHQRKHLMPAFNVKVIRDLYPLFWRKGRQMVEAIQSEYAEPSSKEIRRFEFNDWTTRVTLDIIGIAGFGRDFNAVANEKDELVDKYEELLDPAPINVVYFGASMVLSPRFVNILMPGKNKQLRDVTTTIEKYALDLIKERRQQMKANAVEDRVDILSQIVKSDVFSDTEIKDQILTMLAAGHETTSSALTWVAYLLSINSDVQQKLRDEIRNTIGSLDDDIDSDLIESMPYLNAVCNETLRLYPTVPITVREAIHDTTVANVPIHKGTTLMLCPWAINRSRQFWGDDAETFNPDRWMAPGTSKTGGATTNYATITFLHGSRSCVGRDFAQSELKCLVSSLVGRFEIKLAMPEKDVMPAGVITTKPKNGMWLSLTRVDGW